MGLFKKKKPSLEELEDRKEYLTVQSEVVSKEAEVAEKEAIIKELKKKYGSGWRNILGLKGVLNLQTLRSVLADSGRGLRKMGSSFISPELGKPPSIRFRR